ncbi:MAG: hypothetical protein HDS11_02530 [Bacteroides sp.]|nr:hypothetical protein [Bacteroides sp.]
MSANKRKINRPWYSDISPILIILLLAVPLLILGATTFSSISRVNNTKKEIITQTNTLNSLRKKYNNLHADNINQKIEKFDLQGKEENLSKKYTSITNQLFENPSFDWFKKNGVSAYVPYFGKNESKQLGNRIVQQSILRGNKDVNITFSDFDINSKTILIHIFNTYTLDPDLNTNKTGSSYMEVKYDFNTNKGTLESCYLKDKEESSDD